MARKNRLTPFMLTTSSSINELAHVIEREPVGLIDPELRGLFAAIGIQKGKEFAPDGRI